jgi:hypothetical protein
MGGFVRVDRESKKETKVRKCKRWVKKSNDFLM